MALSFPGRPAQKELDEWGSALLMVDSHIAGYAIRVEKGSLDPRGITEADSLVSEVADLQRRLRAIQPQIPAEENAYEQFVRYVLALQDLTRALAALARGEEHTASQ
ncbi:hypothetical protein ACFVS9_17600 [Streptomyces sp. NPDC058008]|uniref:hypothetical protein n=1 Tax=Streptomyces sp. NPDC058008 TaxID=3346303 RepID=UPI0036E1E482